MKKRIIINAVAVIAAIFICLPSASRGADADAPPMIVDAPAAPAGPAASAAAPLMIHIFVALCDNENQGVEPVSPRLGDGNDPYNNLYWGAKFGVKSFFKVDADWELLTTIKNYDNPVLERALFRRADGKALIVADAYRGRDIKTTVEQFLLSAAGGFRQRMSIELDDGEVEFRTGGLADIIVYVGHNGLMDFSLNEYPENLDGKTRETIVLTSFSRDYFENPLKKAGAPPLLLTTGLMAPEAYILKAVFDGRLLGESREMLLDRIAKAYDRYQGTGFEPSRALFMSPPPEVFIPEKVIEE